ncbi:SEC-C metal-binding domain-containing protein [Methylocystis bryophila]
MAQPTRAVKLNQPKNAISPVKTKKVGRNDPCPCGSGAKYKRRHGR